MLGCNQFHRMMLAEGTLPGKKKLHIAEFDRKPS
jgi:hypothetical protein